MRRADRRPSSGEREGPRAARPAPATRANLYDEVTGRIIAELEAGRAPWVQPWEKVGTLSPGLPHNATTSRRYSGVNILLLWGAVIQHGYPSQAWLTFRQALNAGGAVRKGERGTLVVYADRFTPKAEAERAAREGGEAQAVPFLKQFVVFNVAQCDGLREGLASDPAPLPEREIIPRAEALIEATGADFRIGGDKAFYAPGDDFIQVPPQPAFREQINYYRTCFHELGLVASVLPGRARCDRPGPRYSFQHGRQNAPAIGGARDDRRRPATAYRAVFRSAAAFGAGRLRSPLVGLRRRGLALAGSEC